MANANTPYGLRPHGYLSGSPWNGQARMYCIPSSDGNAYAIGDPVKVAGSADVKGIPTVVLMTPGSGMTGVIVAAAGTKYGASGGDPTNLNTTIVPATKSKDYYVLVCDDPNVLYTVQEVGTGTPLAAADVALNANLVAGTNNGYISQWMVNNATEATTSTLDLQLMSLAPIPDNTFGAYAKWIVRINNHSYNAGITAAS